MTWDIPNYDSIVGRAALPDPPPSKPAPRPRTPTLSEEDAWDPNKVELDIEELEECLSSRQ